MAQPTVRFWLVALLIALGLSGCSKLQILYDQLDWLILGFVEERIPVDDVQREQAREDISALLSWHCRTQIPKYRELLGEIASKVEAGETAIEQVAGYGARVEDLFDRILEQAISPFARLLADLKPEQVDEMYRRAARDNAKTQREIVRTSAREAAVDYRETAVEQLERWLGPLNPAQSRAIDDWSRAVEPLGTARLDYRKATQERLRELLQRYRGDRAGMESALRALVASLPELRPPGYRELVARNQTLAYRMVSTSLASIDDTQRRHLRSYVAGLRSDLAVIDCD